jgi:hypothetical protein
MAADRPYGEFYDFHSVSPDYFGYTLIREQQYKENVLFSWQRCLGERYLTDILIYSVPLPYLFTRSVNSAIPLVFSDYVGFIPEQILLYMQSLLPNQIRVSCDIIIQPDGRDYICA